MKTQEKLEELLKPGVNSLNLSLCLASGSKKTSNGAKQKDKVTGVLQEYVHCSKSISYAILISLLTDMVFLITLEEKSTMRAICMSKCRKSSSASGSWIIGQSRRPRRRKTITGNIHRSHLCPCTCFIFIHL